MNLKICYVILIENIFTGNDFENTHKIGNGDFTFSAFSEFLVLNLGNIFNKNAVASW